MTDVAVVIPARNAARTLPATLAALAAQRFDGTSQVVVVDDGSTDDTLAIAEAAGVRVLVTRSGGGPAEARNVGVAATDASVIAFTDADCEPHPDWLARGVAEVRAGCDLVQGPILPTQGVPVGPFDRTLYAREPSPLFQTANLFVTRAAFDRAGGFPRIPSTGFAHRGLRLPPGAKSFGEDTLFGWAVKRGGARVGFAPGALVHHAVFPRGPRGFIAERERLRYFPALVREVPELRGQLFGPCFLSRRTASFDLAVVGAVLALATRRPVPLALAAPYVRTVRAPWPPRRGTLRVFAAHVAADAVGLAALVSGSADARRPVL